MTTLYTQQGQNVRKTWMLMSIFLIIIIGLGFVFSRVYGNPNIFYFYNIVENLAITAGLPMPKIYVIEDPSPNAFATGRDKNHSVVAVTTGLLSIMNKTELEGVVAHEMSHIGNKDMLLSTVAVVLVGFVAIVSDMMIRMSFFGGNRDDREGNGLFMIIGIVVAILAPIAATLIQLAISRKREYL